MIIWKDRLRTTTNLRSAFVSGYSPPSTPRYYTIGTSKVGSDKKILDKIVTAPLLEKRVKTGYRFYRNKAVRKDRIISDVKPVTIQSFKGYCSKGTLDTRGFLPKGYTDYVLTGEFANTIGTMPSVPTSLIGGKTWGDLSRSPVYDADLVSWCLQKAWNVAAEPDGQISVALAEIPQLLSLITSPFKLAIKFRRQLQVWYHADVWVCHPQKGLFSLRTKRKADPGRVTKNVLDEASNRWLELQYGLLPTIDDAEVVLSALNDKLEPLREIMYGKSKYTALKTRKVFSGVRSTNPAFNFTCKAVVESKLQYTSKVYYRYKNVPNLKERLGFRGEDMFSVLWELTPWSFVVDWLWDIGGLIHRLSAMNYITVASNYVSVKYDQKLVGYITEADYMGYKLKPPTSRLYYHQEELVRLANQPLPDYPQFNVKWFNITRSLNALSLLWQNLPR